MKARVTKLGQKRCPQCFETVRGRDHVRSPEHVTHKVRTRLNEQGYVRVHRATYAHWARDAGVRCVWAAAGWTQSHKKGRGNGAGYMEKGLMFAWYVPRWVQDVTMKSLGAPALRKALVQAIAKTPERVEAFKAVRTVADVNAARAAALAWAQSDGFRPSAKQVAALAAHATDESVVMF